MDQLTEEDRAVVCRPRPPATRRAAWRLATELLPRGCYVDFGDAKIRTAIGHWDESNAIFRCACVCPECRFRACNRRMWWKLDDHDNHLCDACKHYVGSSLLSAKQTSASHEQLGTLTSSKRLDCAGLGR